MSDDGTKDDDSGSGCLFVLGVIIAGLAIGHLYSEAYGWLLIGITFMIGGFVSLARKPR
jgi:hypothetical protein